MFRFCDVFYFFVDKVCFLLYNKVSIKEEEKIMSVTNKVKIAMLQKNKKNADIAECLQISEQGVRGKFTRSSFFADDLIKIADFLGYKLAFLDGDDKIVFEPSDIKDNKVGDDIERATQK